MESIRDCASLAIAVAVVAIGVGIVLGFIIGLYAKD